MAEKYLSTHTGAEIDAAVDKAIDPPVLLWSNSSPHSKFDAQTVTVSDMSKYDYIIFEFCKDYNSNYCHNLMKFRYAVNRNCELFTSLVSSGTVYIYNRTATITSATTVLFTIGYLAGGESTSQIIPIAIYGTNTL